jgi:predicted GNAT family acetyltransferase
MPQSIANHSPEAVIEAIEENLIEASASLGRTEEGVVFRGSDVTWVYTGYRALSRVLRARFTTEAAGDRVAEISECFKQWDAPVLWVVGPTSWPPQLPDLLKECGFGNSEFWTGMAVDLKNIPTDLTAAADLRMEVVTDSVALKQWATLTRDFWDGDSAETAAEIFSPENAGGDPRCRYYLAYHGNDPVARLMSYVRGETVGLYWIGTPQEFHDRGYDIALARHALTEARTTGAKVAVMPSRNSAEAVSRTLNFRPHCQFKVYTWPSLPLRMPLC